MIVRVCGASHGFASLALQIRFRTSDDIRSFEDKLMTSQRVNLKRHTRKIAMKAINNIIKEFKVEVRELYGRRLRNVILYGSYARGEATDDSDIDMAVVLEGDISPGREIDRMIDIITDMNLKHNILISIYPVSEIDYLTLKSPLLMNVRKERVPI